jgi:hypothetical protein
MVLENVLVAFFMPKGMIIQSNTLDLVINIDLWMFFSAILIYQNPDCRFRIENHCALPSYINTSSTKGMGKESRQV